MTTPTLPERIAKLMEFKEPVDLRCWFHESSNVRIDIREQFHKFQKLIEAMAEVLADNGGDPLHIAERICRSEDEQFIAASRTDVPRLVEVVNVLSEGLEFYGEGKHIARIRGEAITPDLVRTNRAEGTIEVGWRARQALVKAAEILKGEIDE